MSSVQTEEEAALMRVGDLAKKTQKTVRAIHLYEELGLLQPARRTSGGFRLYAPGAAERIRWIDMLHGMGFSLHEMREVLRSWWNAELGPDAMDDLRGLFQRKLEETRQAIQRFQSLEHELVEGLQYLETCRVCATRESVNGCVHCRQDHGMSTEPALVAGIMSVPEPRGQRPTGRGLVRVQESVRRSGG